VGRGLSKQQQWLKAQPLGRYQTLTELTEAYYGTVSEANIAHMSRSLKRYRSHGYPSPLPDKPTLSGRLEAVVEVSDCLEFLRRQPADSVDLIFASPPYAEGQRAYRENGRKLTVPQGEAWVKWMVTVVEESLRVCKGLVAYVVKGGTDDFCYSATPEKLIVDLSRKGICLRRPSIYGRYGIPGSGGPDWFREYYEHVVFFTRGGKLPWSNNKALGKETISKINGYPSYRKGEREKYKGAGGREHYQYVQHDEDYAGPDVAVPGDIIWCGATGNGGAGNKLAHQSDACFPELLVEVFVLSFCPPGGLVLDPFCGSGTALAVALQQGRRAIGCDLRESQVRLTKRRLQGITPPMWA
jgi:DNA modification methylase